MQTPGSNRSDPFASSDSTERGEQPLQGPANRSVTSFRSGSSGTGRRYSPSSSQISNLKVQPANPFFDNIRQNLELSHGGGHEHISLELPKDAADRADDLPPWLAELAAMPDQASAERLAEEFYKVERGEQKRLQAVMDWHSNTSGSVVNHAPEAQRELDERARAKFDSWTRNDGNGQDYFPYSITAGVEQGTKNR